jgi:chromosome segregation ATPase
VLLLSYQIIGQQIRVISWMSLRKALIAVVIFGNSYYKVIDPQILSYIAVALILIDNFQLSSINVELSTQNETLEKNNAKLKEAQESLTKLEEELNQLVKPAGKLQAAQRTNTEKAETLNGTISEIIQNIPSRLQNVNVMLRKLLSMPEMTELVSFEADLRSKVDAMVLAFDGFFTELGPVAQKVEGLSAKLETRVATLEATIVLERKHVVALNVVLQKVQSYSQRRQR